MRLAFRLTGIALGLGACLLADLFWRIARRPSPWPAIFLRWTGRCCGLRLRIEGRPAAPLLVANHESWLDILAIGGNGGARFVARGDVAGWPLIGWLARRHGTIFVAREDRRGARDQADALAEALGRGGVPVALFPEGTTAGGPRVLPFRPSLFAACYPPRPGLRVQPVAIDYGRQARAVSWEGDEPFGANARRILARRAPIPVTLRYLAPIDPAQAGDRKALAAAARAAVIGALAASDTPADRL